MKVKRTRSLRREVSLVLLLSALTAIVLGVFGALLASVLAANASGAEATRMAAVVAQDYAMVREPDGEFPAELAAAALEHLDQIGVKLGGLDSEKAAFVLRDLQAYRAILERFVAAPADARREGLVKDQLASSHVTLERSLVYLAHVKRPVWLDRWLAALPWILFWVFATAGVAVWRAWRLKDQFSGPLEALAAASARVGRGEFNVEMPPAEGVSEIAALRESIESMRKWLVTSLARVDASREELQMILQHMTDGVALIDRGGEIRELNPAFRRHWEDAGGRGRAPDRERRLDEVFPELPPEMLRGLRPHDAEVEIGSKGAGTVFRVRVNPVRDGSARVLVLHDVTRERELENAQRNFLSVVTHELKTPLTVVLGYTKLMLAGKGGTLNPQQTEFISLVEREARKLKEMIQDLLDIARIDGDNLPMERRVTPIAPVVDHAVRAHAGPAEAAGVELSQDLAALDGARCALDDVRFQQVLGNLIGNAIKFTPKGGRITVRGARGEDEVRVQIADTGRGVPAKALPHLFEKFYQVDKDDTRLAGGAGLGLYISRKLMEAHGGRIAVESTYGQGTTFTLLLPLATEV